MGSVTDMETEAIKKLFKICDMETDDTTVGWKKRRDALEEWLDQYVHHCRSELHVVNPHNFNSETVDFIKENLSKELSEDLTTYTYYDTQKTKFRAELLVIRPKLPKK